MYEAAMRAPPVGKVFAAVEAFGLIDPGSTGTPYQTFFELMNEGALTIDNAGRILLCNSCFAMLMRESIDQLRGDCFYN